MSKIGVFWFFDGEVLGEKTQLSEAQQSLPGLLDSDATHVAVWEKYGNFTDSSPILAHYDYQDIPRGRVLYQLRKQRFIVYLDKALISKEVKSAIAEYFGFTPHQADWKSDLHYTTDMEAIAQLLED
ncbi:hypothetical protein Q5L94_03240 [Idiomarina sp. Sol25]|uniref:hypothetical protein n=1 Tax=Idiomarina sp. Sol25 TaxID=3064000 RepID=UPI00294B4DF4|nr:hypothetical protein [Idiomarina sp. Sol25]MDV6327056.1 hypothetical protein [Idiomarina sp. Sol25]